jgi:hypothetical protein
LKKIERPEDFAATDTTYRISDLTVKTGRTVDRPVYVHGAVANINRFLGEVVEMRQELGAHQNRV